MGELPTILLALNDPANRTPSPMTCVRPAIPARPDCRR